MHATNAGLQPWVVLGRGPGTLSAISSANCFRRTDTGFRAGGRSCETRVAGDRGPDAGQELDTDAALLVCSASVKLLLVRTVSDSQTKKERKKR